jgi:hypothetical protein
MPAGKPLQFAPDQVAKIRALKDQGVSLKALAERFGVSVFSILKIAGPKAHTTSAAVAAVER